MTEPAAGPSGPGTVIMELGAGVGALVLYTPADLDGEEIEISREDDPGVPGSRRTHSRVRPRRRSGLPAHAFADPAAAHARRDEVRGRLPGPASRALHGLARRAQPGGHRDGGRRAGQQLRLAELSYQVAGGLGPGRQLRAVRRPRPADARRKGGTPGPFGKIDLLRTRTDLMLRPTRAAAGPGWAWWWAEPIPGRARRSGRACRP